MLRFLLVSILLTLIVRVVGRLFNSFVEGLTGQPRNTQIPQRGVQMVRDPVCGTFVVPDHAISLMDGHTRLFFCSNACRNKYRARTA